MKGEHEDLRDTIAGTFDGGFDQPTRPELAQLRVVLCAAALAPLQRLSVQDGSPVDPAIAEWLTPDVADLIDEIGIKLNEVYDILELAEDDAVILEPGTLGNQQFQDIAQAPQPHTPAAPPQIGPQGVPRGDVIR